MCRLPRKMPPHAYLTAQYVLPLGGIFLGKWRISLAGSSEGKMDVISLRSEHPVPSNLFLSFRFSTMRFLREISRNPQVLDN
jgi:hypothetical protein